MDHPVKDIPAVLRKSAHGTPQEQNDALKAYFLPTAALSAPFVRVPSVADHSVRYLGIVNSRRAIYVLFRLRNLLVRTLEFSVESAVYDQRTATLTLQTSQKLSTPLPLHAPKITSTLVLRLAQRSIDAHGRVLAPSEDTAPLAMGVRTRLYVSELEALVRPGELLKLFVPFLGEGVDLVVRACFTFWLLVVGCVLVPLAGLFPEAVVRNGDVLADKDR